MLPRLLAYLKRKKLTDVKTVNRLFVSTFIELSGIDVKGNDGIVSLMINDKDEEYALLQDFVKRAREAYPNGMELENLIRLFEFVVSPAERVVTGAVYTPLHIRRQIVENCFTNMNSQALSRIKVADISCGCGSFLIDVAMLLHCKTSRSWSEIFSENIYGIDIQEYAVDRTKILLTLLALQHGENTNFKFHILHADTLDFRSISWNGDYTHFDVIVGNPPYVCSRNMSDLMKEKTLRYDVCKTGHPDLYIPFFQIAVEMLVPGGKMGLITMNSFLQSVNGRALRHFFSQGNHDISIRDFRGAQIFQGRSTYTCLFMLTKNKSTGGVKYSLGTPDDKFSVEDESFIPFSHLDDWNGWALNDPDCVRKMEAIGEPLGKICRLRQGIATLQNNVYIFTPIMMDDFFYYIQFNGTTMPVERQVCRDVVNPNKLNSNVALDCSSEKIIFPYSITDDLKANVIAEDEMSELYPFAYRYLMLNRDRLVARDKGKGRFYPVWYAYGRNQSLVMPGYKLFIPRLANKPVSCVLSDDPELMFYNGVAFVDTNLERLCTLKRIIESDYFWQYIIKKSKPYSSDYYSISAIDVKKFGIPVLSQDDKTYLLSLNDKAMINNWLSRFYE